MTLWDFEAFLSRFDGNIKLIDMGTGSFLYKCGADDTIPDDYWDCEVGISYIERDTLVIEVNYTFHEIQE